MITGIGTDLVEIARVQKAIGRSAFLKKVYTEREQELIEKRKVRSAGNFAAKEAVAKALGCGFSGIAPIEIEVLRREDGAPYVVLHGRAKHRAEQMGVSRIHISLTDTEVYAQAYAICEAEDRFDTAGRTDVSVSRGYLTGSDEKETQYRRPFFDAKGIKEVDRFTMEELGLSSSVLMERAALAVVECVETYAMSDTRIGVLCGTGNNGGDGVAVARILKEAGYDASVLLRNGELQDSEVVGTPEFIQQLKIAKATGVPICSAKQTREYEIIVDALFGVGLSRPVTGEDAAVLERINKEAHIVIAVDIASGINASTGRVEGVALRADETVTFGGLKCGHMLYPGKEYSGRVTVADIGFGKQVLWENRMGVWYEPQKIEELLPERPADSHKGTFGKVAVIAGSRNMAGAAYLSAGAAYRAGAGLVKVVTPECNREIIQTLFPEAMLTTYKGEEDLDGALAETLRFADVIVIGPGLGREPVASRLVSKLCAALKEETSVPVTIWDADALNHLAMTLNEKELGESKERCRYLEQLLPKRSILTPHPKELSRLLNRPVEELSADFFGTALEIGESCDLTFVLKNAATVVVSGKDRFINTTGNNGMSTGGSGDVLTGIIAALVAAGKDCFEAAAGGVWIHGAAGDAATGRKSAVSVIAGDILAATGELLTGKGDEKVK